MNPSTPPGAGPQVARWRNVFVLSGTILFTLTGIFGWHRVLSLYLRGLGASETEVGWGMLLLGFSNRIPQLVGGWMADRIGRKRIVAVITTSMGLCYIAIGLAHEWGMVVALIALCWILGGFQWPALLSLVADSVPEHQRGRAMGLLESASMVGLTVGPLLGGLVLERHRLLDGGWTILLVGCGALYLGSATARGLFLVETSTERVAHPFFSRLGSIDWRILAAPIATYTLAMCVNTLVTDGSIQSFYLTDVNRLSESDVNFLNAIGGVGAFASAIVSGWLVDKLGARRVISASFGLALIVLVPFLLPLDVGVGVHPWLAQVSLVAIFVPVEMFIVAYQMQVTSIAPAGSRALYVGAASLAAGLMIPWVNPLGIALYEADTPWHRAPFWLAAVMAAAGLLVPLAMKGRGTPTASPGPSIPAAR